MTSSIEKSMIATASWKRFEMQCTRSSIAQNDLLSPMILEYAPRSWAMTPLWRSLNQCKGPESASSIPQHGVIQSTT